MDFLSWGSVPALLRKRTIDSKYGLNCDPGYGHRLGEIEQVSKPLGADVLSGR